MEKDLISVIIPVYNVQEYLIRCLDSIVNQTYKNLEILIVDDGSSDNCPQICDEFARKDGRIRVIHKDNEGLSSARNTGLNIFKGKFVCFVDSDDFISREYIKVLYDSLIKSNADISECLFIKFKNEDTTMLDNALDSYNYPTNYKTVIFNGRELQFKLLEKEYTKFVVVWNKLYKRELFDNVRFPIGKIHEDEYTTYKIYNRAQKICAINEYLYFYRQSHESITNSIFNKARLDVIEAFEERKKFYIEDKELFVKTVIRYQELLKQYYFKAKQFAKNDKTSIDYIINRLKYNYKDLKKMNINKSVKIKYFSLTYLNDLYYFLTRCKELYKHGFLLCKIKSLEYRIKQQKKYSNKNNIKSVFLFNTPIHGNLGDQALMLSEYSCLKNLKIKFVDIPNYDGLNSFKSIQQYISDDDLILIHAGGYLGTIWDNENVNVNYLLNRFKNNKIIIMPQTVFYDKDLNGYYSILCSKKIFDDCKDLTLFVREKYSFNFVKEKNLVKNVFLCPDIVLYNGIYNYKSNIFRKNSIICLFRKDREKMQSYDYIIKEVLNNNDNYDVEYSDTVLAKKLIYFSQKEKEIGKLLNQLRNCKFCFTDRLHGMIFAYLTHTPCIVFSNNNYKIKGVYEWIKKCDFIRYYDRIDNLDIIKNDFNSLINIDNNGIVSSFEKEFDNLCKALMCGVNKRGKNE